MIILASQSQIRRQLLTSAGVQFSVQSPILDEDELKQTLTHLAPKHLAERLALEKAQSIMTDDASCYAIGADQTLELEGRLINKCMDMHEAKTLLKYLSAKTHLLHSAINVVHNGKTVYHHTATVKMHMRMLTELAIETHLQMAGSTVLSSVGCYQYENVGIQLFEQVEGDYHAILGMPLLPLLAFLREIGELAP